VAYRSPSLDVCAASARPCRAISSSSAGLRWGSMCAGTGTARDWMAPIPATWARFGTAPGATLRVAREAAAASTALWTRLGRVITVICLFSLRSAGRNCLLIPLRVAECPRVCSGPAAGGRSQRSLAPALPASLRAGQ
jgi:hypothetical protein